MRTLASLAEAELASLLTPRQVQAVLISGVEVVSHLDEKPFALSQLVAPLLTGEHVAFRRYAEFADLREELVSDGDDDDNAVPHRTYSRLC